MLILHQLSNLFHISLTSVPHDDFTYLFDITKDQKKISIYSETPLNHNLILTLKHVFEELHMSVISTMNPFHQALFDHNFNEVTSIAETFSQKDWVLAKINVSQPIEDLIQLTLSSSYQLTYVQPSYYLLIEENHHELILSNLINTIETELMVNAQCFYSPCIPDLSQLYHQRETLDEYQLIASKYHLHHPLISQKDLSFPLLVHHLSKDSYQQSLVYFKPLQTEFLKDDETMKTIEAFFENHLNIAETSRALYIHRNTLIYRLEKIHTNLGLDLRDFHQAMKLAFYLYLSKR